MKECDLGDPDPKNDENIVSICFAEVGGGRDRYRRYFREKGITILVGGTGNGWARLFPEHGEWESLHPPLTSSDGGEIVFLRVPGEG